MAVIVKYVVVRDGKEDMIFTTKKEADAYDKMLDIAEQLHNFIQASEIDMAPDQLDDLTFFMAQHRDQIGRILKGAAPESSKRATSSKAQAETSDAMGLETEVSGAPAGQKASETPKGSSAAKSKAAA